MFCILSHIFFTIRFNILKRHYRTHNIYTFPDTIEKFKTNDSIDIHIIEEDDFRDWDQLLSLLYNKIKDVSKFHIFNVNKNEPSILYKREDNISDLIPVAQVMLKRKAEGDDRDSDKLSNGECMGVDFERAEVVLVAKLFWKETHTKNQQKAMAKFLPVIKIPWIERY